MINIKGYKKVIEFNEKDFIRLIKRKPKNQKELDLFYYYLSKGIDAQLDYYILDYSIICFKQYLKAKNDK